MTFIAMPVQSYNLVVTHVFLGSPATLHSGVTLERVFLHILEDVHRASVPLKIRQGRHWAPSKLCAEDRSNLGFIKGHANLGCATSSIYTRTYCHQYVQIGPTFWFGGVEILPLTSCIPPKPTNHLAAEMITDK
ncbi:hypothetical protein CY34DRAFT_200393 [Suillus luteus UH-Slu-Lm8-n1]|uniref:Uncharacterized protein n=1 Tax=Suillus luteus UH-Slu-Lm8-n1 TaxID=930992 RepID=A0A0D0BE25_9AGAM|nr:hypothetical protein CY34DRAFT_200393 [Suillus luteus UH-Slu-Lm8-n1]